jgi:hypothetical protein
VPNNGSNISQHFSSSEGEVSDVKNTHNSNSTH